MIAAVHAGLAEFWANPSSVHRAGQAARHQVELARQSAAALLGLQPSDAKQIIFTSGGTEALVMAIRGLLDAASPNNAAGSTSITPNLPTILSSRVEHAAVIEHLEDLEKTKRAAIRWIPVDRNGVVQVDQLAAIIESITAPSNGLTSRAPVLCVMQWANNETGVIQPVHAVGSLCRQHRVPFVCDAMQWVGKEPIHQPIDQSPAPYDILAASAHKFHGPKGVGMLWVSPRLRWKPTQLGSQELGRRGGTENVSGILGLRVACEEAMQWLADPSARARGAALRDRFEQGVLARIPGVVINGQQPSVNASPVPRADEATLPSRLWNTTNIGFPQLEAEALLLLLSERGVFASAGAACSSGSLDPSPVLLAMGVPDEIAHGSLRFSLSKHTTEVQIDQAITVIAECVSRLRASSASVGI